MSSVAEEKVRVVGVDCPACSVAIQRRLAGLGASIDIDLVTGESLVRFDLRKATLRDVARAIRDAGYDVEKRSLTLLVDVGEEEAARFEAAVARVRGVFECRYSPVTKLARVVYNPYSITEKELVEEIEKLGFEVSRAGEEAVEEVEERGTPLAPLASFALGLAAVTLHAAEAFALIPHLHENLYAALAALVLLLNARLLNNGFRALARRSPTMDSLVALSSTVTFAYSALAMLGVAHGTTFFEASAGVLGFVSAGKYLEERLKARALQSIRELAELQRGRARVVRDGSLFEVDSSEVKVGDTVEVRAGELIPVDGVVVEGWGYVDESTFTGEPVPRFKTAERRDPVLAGTLLTSGFLRVMATRVGRDTNLAYIIETVKEAQFRKPGFQRLADRLVGYLTWTVLTISAFTFVFWLLSGESVSTAAMFAAAVLAVTCPCPLGIAVPLVTAVAAVKAAKLGVLVRGGDVFEKIVRVDTVVFDKTGTLTSGLLAVRAVYTFNGYSEAEVLKLAGSAERRSEHPIAKALVKSCAEVGVELAEPESYDHVPGMGIIAKVDGRTVAVGSLRLLEQLEAAVPREALDVAARLTGATLIFVAVDGRLAGLVEVRDAVRAEAPLVVQYLKREGIEVVLATGDGRGAGESVARALGIKKVYCELRPEDKADLVEELQREGKRVAFVGDGINDAAAIGRAFLGVAMGGGADVSREAGDAVIISNDLLALAHLRELGKAAKRKAVENLAWAFAYNASLVPVAAGALYKSMGLALRPELAALAMILSDISVVANAATLLRWKPLLAHRARAAPST
jgi:Cu2+-exporting ATPase/Cu+-exporting ATPase